MSLLGATEPRPRVPPLGEAATLFNEAVSHRMALGALELAEARNHATTSAWLVGVMALFAFLGALIMALTLAGLVWDSPHRAWWLAGMGVTSLGGAGITALILRRRLQSWQPLGEIRKQLQLDHQCLSQLIKAILP